MSKKSESFDAFWHHYLRDHARPGTRALHFFGTTVAVVSVVAAIVEFQPLLILAGVLIGYGFAWFGHFVVEKNRPSMIAHPFWSFAADLRMTWLWYAGRLGTELAAAGIAEMPDGAERAEARSD
ncbi:DUF962 domain-containing protein [Methyloligella sp. 2.7D]|uniref:DUF962 domain-containing protein n=1 Tax=unclassified Methyloligella TaxID=2625955 RepID=UPI001ABA93D3|nr:DUF962 domain-containing protein [Methyloligella sp. GL2]